MGQVHGNVKDWETYKRWSTADVVRVLREGAVSPAAGVTPATTAATAALTPGASQSVAEACAVAQAAVAIARQRWPHDATVGRKGFFDCFFAFEMWPPYSLPFVPWYTAVTDGDAGTGSVPQLERGRAQSRGQQDHRRASRGSMGSLGSSRSDGSYSVDSGPAPVAARGRSPMRGSRAGAGGAEGGHGAAGTLVGPAVRGTSSSRTLGRSNTSKRSGVGLGAGAGLGSSGKPPRSDRHNTTGGSRGGDARGPPEVVPARQHRTSYHGADDVDLSAVDMSDLLAVEAAHADADERKRVADREAAAAARAALEAAQKLGMASAKPPIKVQVRAKAKPMKPSIFATTPDEWDFASSTRSIDMLPARGAAKEGATAGGAAAPLSRSTSARSVQTGAQGGPAALNASHSAATLTGAPEGTGAGDGTGGGAGIDGANAGAERDVVSPHSRTGGVLSPTSTRVHDDADDDGDDNEPDEQAPLWSILCFLSLMCEGSDTLKAALLYECYLASVAPDARAAKAAKSSREHRDGIPASSSASIDEIKMRTMLRSMVEVLVDVGVLDHIPGKARARRVVADCVADIEKGFSRMRRVSATAAAALAMAAAAKKKKDKALAEKAASTPSLNAASFRRKPKEKPKPKSVTRHQFVAWCTRQIGSASASVLTQAMLTDEEAERIDEMAARQRARDAAAKREAQKKKREEEDFRRAHPLLTILDAARDRAESSDVEDVEDDDDEENDNEGYSGEAGGDAEEGAPDSRRQVDREDGAAGSRHGSGDGGGDDDTPFEVGPSLTVDKGGPSRVSAKPNAARARAGAAPAGGRAASQAPKHKRQDARRVSASGDFTQNVDKQMRTVKRRAMANAETRASLQAEFPFTDGEMRTLADYFAASCSAMGRLPKSRFVVLIRAMFPGCSKSLVELLFARVDRTRRQNINFREFVWGISQLVHSTIQEKLLIIFDLHGRKRIMSRVDRSPGDSTPLGSDADLQRDGDRHARDGGVSPLAARGKRGGQASTSPAARSPGGGDRLSRHTGSPTTVTPASKKGSPAGQESELSALELRVTDKELTVTDLANIINDSKSQVDFIIAAARAAMEVIDADGDGEITPPEFRDCMLENKHLLDALTCRSTMTRKLQQCVMRMAMVCPTFTMDKLSALWTRKGALNMSLTRPLDSTAFRMFCKETFRVVPGNWGDLDRCFQAMSDASPGGVVHMRHALNYLAIGLTALAPDAGDSTAALSDFVFRLADVKRRGYVSPDEVLALLLRAKAESNADAKMLLGVVDDLDQDGDGCIDYHEFKERAGRHPVLLRVTERIFYRASTNAGLLRGDGGRMADELWEHRNATAQAEAARKAKLRKKVSGAVGAVRGVLRMAAATKGGFKGLLAAATERAAGEAAGDSGGNAGDAAAAAAALFNLKRPDPAAAARGKSQGLKKSASLAAVLSSGAMTADAPVKGYPTSLSTTSGVARQHPTNPLKPLSQEQHERRRDAAAAADGGRAQRGGRAKKRSQRGGGNLSRVTSLPVLPSHKDRVASLEAPASDAAAPGGGATAAGLPVIAEAASAGDERSRRTPPDGGRPTGSSAETQAAVARAASQTVFVTFNVVEEGQPAWAPGPARRLRRREPPSPG